MSTSKISILLFKILFNHFLNLFIVFSSNCSSERIAVILLDFFIPLSSIAMIRFTSCSPVTCFDNISVILSLIIDSVFKLFFKFMLICFKSDVRFASLDDSLPSASSNDFSLSKRPFSNPFMISMSSCSANPDIELSQ